MTKVFQLFNKNNIQYGYIEVYFTHLHLKIIKSWGILLYDDGATIDTIRVFISNETN